MVFFPDHCCIAFDMWTDNYRRVSYITYTCHLITDEWKLQSRILKTSMFEHPHTSRRIEENFNAVIAEYSLQEKEIISVVDGAINVNRTVDDMGLIKIGCIAHSINRLIQFDLFEKGEGIKEATNVIKRLRRIQQALLYRYGELTNIAKAERQKQIFDLLEEITAAEEALEADERFNIEDLTRGPASMEALKSISSVRWNCIFKMCNAHFQNSGECYVYITMFIAVKTFQKNVFRHFKCWKMFHSFNHFIFIAVIKKCLEHHAAYDLILSRTEIGLLGRIVEVLDVFNTFTKYIQGNSYPTLNSLILFYVEIKQKLEEIQRDSICEVINRMINILLENLDNRFKLTDVYIAAAILDPSSQHLPIINIWLRDKGNYSFLRSKLSI